MSSATRSTSFSRCMISRLASAAAQQAGVPRAAVVKALGEGYAEVTVGLGIARNGGVIELFTSQDGATWTLVLTMPNGLSRVIASGESWMRLTPLEGRLS